MGADFADLLVYSYLVFSGILRKIFQKDRIEHRLVNFFKNYKNFDQLCKDTASLIAEGNIVGWFQSRMEYGPRALGNRSIIGDPRNPEMQRKLNLKIKYREGFRPFAPSVLEEDIDRYFDLDRPTPYMLLVAPVKEERRNPLPAGHEEMELYKRLYHVRSDIPAITPQVVDWAVGGKRFWCVR